MDIGTSEPLLLLDVLINALTQISSECASQIPISSAHLCSPLCCFVFNASEISIQCSNSWLSAQHLRIEDHRLGTNTVKIANVGATPSNENFKSCTLCFDRKRCKTGCCFQPSKNAKNLNPFPVKDHTHCASFYYLVMGCLFASATVNFLSRFDVLFKTCFSEK